MDSTGLSSNGAAYRSRGYQLEMLEASRKENIIVAMDTGSGKTHMQVWSAILRIIDELEKSDAPDKLIWILAPTVALSLQQHEVITSQILSVKTKILTGLDNVDRWTEQGIWDKVLKDVRVVVSTYAVLADALSHGFVRMSRLALLVFDEAHHCTKRHPANKIMQNHYHPTLLRSGPNAVPHILGLTASPVVRSSRDELETIESNLNAVCKTPRVHRTELLENTHRPHLERVNYITFDEAQYGSGSRLLSPLIECCRAYNIEDDPWIESLRSKDHIVELTKALTTGKTFCREQLRNFQARSRHIYEELGGWAADYFISASIDQLQRSIQDASEMSRLDQMERIYLLELLLAMPAPVSAEESNHVSMKLQMLLDFLEKMDRPGFSGLLFAKQRATVSVLARILSIHPKTRDRFQCAAYVGWASDRNRKYCLGDLLHRDMQRDTLDEFKVGRKNLIVATDVLEEGIDVSACSLVICYDKPANLKSFVQRRGRARHRESTYAVMISNEDELLNLQKWQELEQAMIKAYQDDERRRREAYDFETPEEHVKERLWVEKTSALLTPDDALQHLHHFCAVLPVDEFSNNLPIFSFQEDSVGLLLGTVTLPNSVHPTVRRTTGKAWWRTERAARKETAFQAYKALYAYGLVNDNLLPLTRKPELKCSEDMILPSIVQAAEQYDPYVDLAQGWALGQLCQTRLRICSNGSPNEDFAICLILPRFTPTPQPIPLYWDSETYMELHFDPQISSFETTAETLDQMRRTTALYLQAPSSRQRGDDRDFVALFIPDISHEHLGEWLGVYEGKEPALEVYMRDPAAPPLGIVRDQSKFSEPRIFNRWNVPADVSKSSPIEVECSSLPRRRNLLQIRAMNIAEDGEGDAPKKSYVLPAAACVIDKLPAKQAVFGLFISAILDRLEASLVAHRLDDTILKGVGIKNIAHVITAISAPIAQASTNYQRYEFFGDSVLKFTVSCQLFFRNSNWHEGYLSESRDKLIQNSRLARAALDLGIDRFVLTSRFTPRKWTAPLIRNKLEPSTAKRNISTKVLADVVESLIGAAYVDGGIRRAQACLHRFLPEINLFTNEISPLILPPGKGVSNLINHHRLAGLIGYTFNDPALLTEALTHASCEYDTSTQSYQRLEFLGDAVLDMIVMAVIAAHPVEMDQGPMTLLKHSVVNANLLAFFCMELCAPDEPSHDAQFTNGKIDLVPRYDQIHLWRFLRSHGPNIKSAQEACLERHQGLRAEIRDALENGTQYPWELFARLRADKFLSDIIESVLGAIFIDCGGDLDVCYAFVERIGLVWYIQRVIADGVNVVHPRNIAQNMVKGAGTLVFKRKRVESGGVATYRCSAVVNKSEIALVEGCASAEEAEVKVANVVIEHLTLHPVVST
ncbi:unnamed protein product [Penicillium nalgiovense]|uniref:Dicer-like protein 2 n=1 Tax=Penicillium nalgiovense TaxID=60175 RepID=A0A9W4I5W9_PENNA|nr:unnamed protein product [Penicillium nalgiovense]CAG8005950.1 unnamed protein product [Penicillium nalgiovense]CAG8014501.1 unnamed protein product [Penicillium nalgiovense]CAG8036519.1 unnamed protein product [Penicillium nalgiovense]CAG8050540.1 unnamed protein product [Penicillium nalgiovense]